MISLTPLILFSALHLPTYAILPVRQAPPARQIISRPPAYLPDGTQNILKEQTTGIPLSSEVIVVALKLPTNDTSWLQDDMTWKQSWIYEWGSASALPRVRSNKALEAMAFLSYIIDFYDTLPGVTAFVHPSRYYGAEIRFDTLHGLQNLNASNVKAKTTTSLRCANVIDPNAWEECETNPRHLALDGPDKDVLSPEQVRMMAQMNQTVWRQVLLEGKVEDIGGPACCAQFVVTAGELRKRTRDDYQRQREALIVK